ncbi:conserved hypothetical protein [Coccidioides posadasii str. Silveira]|uniref:Protein kinase domain-containing protein n=1 Tax=Coccidioides posadasii (strain RMSCC 757 / Silveira) TaxID=443226 RepID=E9D2Z9_COCPS|nr:conserved hypothetical protein [Coccidioides posadasii str. Silveira]
MGRQSSSLSSGAQIRRERLSVSFKAISALKNYLTWRCRFLICVVWYWMTRAAVVLGCYCLGLIVSTEYTTLECALRADLPMNLRQKWADQLAASLDHLHLAGIIWGDVKPANILRETVGTVEGDQQGLQKIKSFLLGQDNKANYGELLARLRVTES